MHKHSFKTQATLWLPRIIAAILLLSYGLAVYSIIRSNLIPDRYLLAGISLSAIAIVALLYGLLKPRISRYIKIAAMVVSVVAIIANIYAYSVSSATTNFLSTIQPGRYTTIEYSIIAQKDQSIELSSPNLQTGLLASDPNNEPVKTAVNKLADTSYQPYANPAELTVALSDGATDTAVFQSSSLQLLSEANPPLYETYEVLATFTIQVDNPPSNNDQDTTKPFVVYISGIDTYGDIASVARSDVNILAVVNPLTNQVLLVNTPRDYYVELAGAGGAKDKLTHAGIYGIDTSERTLEILYDTEIDYHLRVNFSSLTKLVDTLGGVTVNSQYAFTIDEYSFQTGPNKLNGAEALAFARERKSFQAGDRTRGENQQRVITAIIQKLSSSDTLVNYSSILQALEGTSQTNMSQDSITSLVKNQLNTLGRWRTTSISVDGSDASATTYSAGSQQLYVMQPNASSVKAAQQQIKTILNATSPQ